MGSKPTSIGVAEPFAARLQMHRQLSTSIDRKLAVEVVIGELVSVSEFPVSRENTGKFFA
jgi:hypothetical protein